MSTLNAIQMIAVERQRQIDEEKFGPEHDDQHADGRLEIAGACYAVEGLKDAETNCPVFVAIEHGVNSLPDAWPWSEKDDKREKHGRKRRLVIAGALIAAALERLLREEKRVEEATHA